MSLEHQFEINSILRIMRDSSDKLRISLVLPQLFEKGSANEECILMIEEYLKEKNSEDISFTTPPYLNYRLIKIIDFFHENVHVLEYFNDWLDELNPVDKSIISSFQLLGKITEQRLSKSAISELNKEKKIHEIYHENENIKRNIKAFQKLLNTQHINVKWKIAAKKGIIQKCEQNLATCKYDNNIKIKQEIVRSSQNIKQIHARSMIKQKELEDEIGHIKSRYQQLLKDNLKKEKAVRDEKNKLLLQLESLIKKFDQIMGDKFKEKMFLQEEYDRQKEKFKEFLIVYKREEEEYERILRAKEEEEKCQHEQKILLFMMNRSARAIQKHWRKFRRAQKKAAKRSKGRGKSKKK